MSEPVDCPYLGLRQNRAIRFAAPTPEHRCYRDGTPVEIPVDQRTYCLTAQHRVCPLYTGQWDASTHRQGGRSATRRAAVYDAAPPSARGSFTGASRRSLAVYFGLIGIVVLCTLFWGAAYYYRAWQQPVASPPAPGEPSPTFALPVVVPPTTVALTPTPTASASPTVVLQPTEAPTASETSTPPPLPSPTVEPTFALIPTVTMPLPEPTLAPPESTPTSEQPTDEVTAVPQPTDEVTALPQPTDTVEPPTVLPTTAPSTPPVVEPTIPPVPTETNAPPTPDEPTATIVLQLTVIPQQRP